MTTVRHFTVTGFVVHKGYCLLHWHPKVKMWLPPGGHIDANEDPVQAVKREIQEETGISAEVVPTGIPIEMNYPTQVHAPFTIMIEDIDDPAQGYHQHIDMIYFCRVTGDASPINDGWLWVSEAELERGDALRSERGQAQPPPEDVRLLAAHAFKVIAETNIHR